MKKLLPLVLAVATLGLFTACGGDDPAPKFMIDDTNLSALGLNAYYVDYGACCSELRTDGIPGTYILEFHVTDGTYSEAQGETTFEPGDEDVHIYLTVFSEGESFENGSYEIAYFNCSGPEPGVMAISAFWMDFEYDYSGTSGDTDVSRNGDRFTFKFDGMMYDWNAYNGSEGPARTDGCTEPPFDKVDISGNFSATFTEVDDLYYAD